MTELVDRLYCGERLSDSELAALIAADDKETADLLRSRADSMRQRYYGKKVFLRGLIEISSCCKNNCLYCGIRCGNSEAERYRLSKEDILSCCQQGYELGFRTFVLQGGEDPYFTDDVMCGIISDTQALPRLCNNAFPRRTLTGKLSAHEKCRCGQVSPAPRGCIRTAVQKSSPVRDESEQQKKLSLHSP